MRSPFDLQAYNKHAYFSPNYLEGAVETYGYKTRQCSVQFTKSNKKGRRKSEDRKIPKRAIRKNLQNLDPENPGEANFRNMHG
jgi:hypothetical protein